MPAQPAQPGPKRKPASGGGLGDLLWSMIPPEARMQYASYGEALQGLAAMIAPGGDYWRDIGRDLSRGEYREAALAVPPAIASTMTDALTGNTMKPARRTMLDMASAVRWK